MHAQLEQCTAFGAGTKAYYDAHVAVFPCTVLEVIEPGNGLFVTSGKLKIRCDEDRGPYKKGETMEVKGYHTFPRKHRIRKGMGYRINPFYKWVKS